MKGFSKKLQLFYQGWIALLLIGSSALFYFYWSSGLMDGSKLSTIYEANVILEDIRDSKSISNIENFVNDNMTRKAATNFESLQEKIKNINKVKVIDSYNALDSSMGQVDLAFKKVVAFSEVREVFKVFHQKLDRFGAFVAQNYWPTLTRMTKRIQKKVNRTQSYDFKTLSNAIGSLKQDFSIMRDVTLSSVLPENKKYLISARVDSMNTELKMLEKYVSALEMLDVSYTKFQKDYKLWSKEIAPEITLLRLSTEDKNKFFSLSFFSLMFLMFIALIAGLFFYSRGLKSGLKDQEDHFIKIINNYLIPENKDVPTDQPYTSEFKNAFTQAKEYLHKRMNFGNIFQNAVPFGAVLLDSNLKVTWANGAFYDIWSITNNKRVDNNISWDFLQRLTNLGEHDPVYDALQNNLAGIYQIQIKSENSESFSPYEMYISPVSVSGKKRIMLFFYSLQSMQETISSQAKTLISPIKRSLQSMIEGTFKSENSKKVESDFEVAGILDIYQDFQTLNDFQIAQRQGLLLEIERIEGEFNDAVKLINDIDGIQDAKKDDSEKSKYNLNHTKKNIISYVEFNSINEKRFSNLIEHLGMLFKNYQMIMKSSDEIVNKVAKNADSYKLLDGIKERFREMLEGIKDSRAKLSQAVDQSLLFQKTSGSDNTGRVEQSFSKIKSNAKALEQIISEFEKVIVNFDVRLTKAQLIFKENNVSEEKTVLKNRESEFKHIHSEVQESLSSIKSSFLQNIPLEENLVENLQRFNQNFENIYKADGSIKSMVTNFLKFNEIDSQDMEVSHVNADAQDNTDEKASFDPFENDPGVRL